MKQEGYRHIIVLVSENNFISSFESESSMKTIERPLYLDRLKGLRGTPDIKVITGVRRSGKSELMRAFVSYLEEIDPQGNIMYVDLMDMEYESLKEYHALYDYFTSGSKENVNNYILIDEVQLCPDFENAVNSLYNKKIYDIYITGSNAFMLSSDLATLFTGRYIDVHVLPFSFSEYIDYKQIKDIDEAFDAYVLDGGMAGSYLYDSERDRMNYISGIFDTIITRDLKKKYNLSDDMALLKTSDFMLDNISNLTSVNKISDMLTANKTPTNHVTIGNYVNYLCKAFLFYKVQRYDIKGKEILKTIEKYYAVDSGFRCARLGRRNMDYGRQYENLVALELMRRGYNVYVGKLYKKEVDFVAINADEKIYIQVSDDISQPETMERELAPLLSIKDAYPKMIIARTKHPAVDREGVKILDIARWLSDSQN